MYLLVTDLHLDDNPVNDYRWRIWEHILNAIIQYRIEYVFVLGDWVDRKDRFSAAFINQLFDDVYRICAHAKLVVLRGNHDTRLMRPNYFDFIAHPVENFSYITHPTPWLADDQLLLLPFTATPKEDWRNLGLSDYRAIFMHATVTGAVVENGTVMENENFPILPRNARIYSGDVHVPQQIRNIVYVGAPHPIKFGDKYPCRMLVLRPDFSIATEILLTPPRKIAATIADVAELDQIQARRGDQIKIRLNCPPDAIGGTAVEEAAIARWAADHGVNVAGIEILVGVRTPTDTDIEQSPEAILKQFAEREGLSADLTETGLSLLREL